MALLYLMVWLSLCAQHHVSCSCNIVYNTIVHIHCKLHSFNILYVLNRKTQMRIQGQD